MKKLILNLFSLIFIGSLSLSVNAVQISQREASAIANDFFIRTTQHQSLPNQATN